MYKKERQTLAQFQRNVGWDLFISAYNDSDRVREVFRGAPAKTKHWCVPEEYGYAESELPADAATFRISACDEASAIADYFSKADVDPAQCRICVDITGFMRPQILFLVQYLARHGVVAFSAVYSEPLMYTRKEHTAFAVGDVTDVRQVFGYEGAHSPDTNEDLLVIGAGYDRDLVARVVGHKESARISFLYGFPSLSADMYQQSVLQMWKPTDTIKGREFGDGVRFTSANDPFTTAAALSDLWKDAKKGLNAKNLYLSPLGTKPQTLGFALFFLKELESECASIIFPFTSRYSRETSSGIGRIWTYSVELQ